MNKVILIGRITKDLDLRYTKTNNKEVLDFTIAVPRKFDKENTDFINCRAWGQIANFMNTYLSKGRQIAVVGRIQMDSWTDDQGQKKSRAVIEVEEVNFADSKKTEDNEPVDFEPSPEDDDLPF